MHKINKFRLTHKLFILRCHTSISAAHRLSSPPRRFVLQLWVALFSCPLRDGNDGLLAFFISFSCLPWKTVIYHLPEIKRWGGVGATKPGSAGRRLTNKILHFRLACGGGLLQPFWHRIAGNDGAAIFNPHQPRRKCQSSFHSKK